MAKEFAEEPTRLFSNGRETSWTNEAHRISKLVSEFTRTVIDDNPNICIRDLEYVMAYAVRCAALDEVLDRRLA